MKFFNNTWESVEILGKGSFGTVYKAKKIDNDSDIEVYSAIKEVVIPNDVEIVNSLFTEGLTNIEIDQELEEIKNNLINEIKLMYKLKDIKNIVSIEDFEEKYEEVDDKKYSKKYIINIRMELLESIDKLLLDDNLLDKEVLKLGLDISNALLECKNNKIIHRDIKVENIFVNKKGVYKLGDFGEAKTFSKTISNLSRRGTENYMSPEIYKGGLADYRSDIYSLGIVLYRFFNNRKFPFIPLTNGKISSGIREEALLKRINGDEIPKPINANEEVSRIILKMLAYKKEDRYDDLNDLIDDLSKEYKNVKRGKKVFTEIVEEDKTISLYGNRKKKLVEVLKLTKEELDSGCNKTISINNKEYEVVIPSNSKEDDEIIIEAEEVNNNDKKEKILIVVVLSLLPLITPSVSSGASDTIKEDIINKKVYRPDKKGLVIKKTNNKLIGFAIGGTGLVVAIVLLAILLPKNNVKDKPTNNKEVKETAKILTCKEIEQEVDDPQEFTYKFIFDKSNNNIEKIEFNAKYPPLGGTKDKSLVNEVAGMIKKSFCGKDGITIDGTCDVKIDGYHIYSSYEIDPSKYLETYKYKSEKNKTLLETIKDDYETRDPEGCFEIYTVSTQGCGEILKTTCEVEEIG